ncbi:MAG: GNAT family N-acetyltransferase [Lachnospiraceae bacterium]|nr:GNAT family N-acetyltransferase [Lachnospiraceae bacterium]
MIRRAIKEDADRILELLVEVCNVHAKLRADLFVAGGTKYNKEELYKIMEDDNKPVFVCINDKGILAGYAFCVVNEVKGDNLVSHKNLYIDDICVSSECRREHVGTKLYEHVIAFAKSIGCYNVTLNVWEGNDAARKFYENCGMKVQKTVLETVI